MKNPKIKEAIEFYWGKRCKDFKKECDICKAWKEYDTKSP